MKTLSLLLSIYDENEMQRQLLHHQIEHLGYQVAFSSSNENELFINFMSGRKPELLLINADGNWKKIVPLIERTKKLYKQTRIVVYVCNESDATSSAFINSGASRVIISCNIQKLIDSLDLLWPIHSSPLQEEEKESVNPFASILKNKKNQLILQHLAKSKNEHEIGELVGLSATTVKTYKQRMKEKLKCKTTGELLALAKDYKII